MTSKTIEVLEQRITKLKKELEQTNQTLRNCRAQVMKLEDLVRHKQGAIAEMLQLAAELKVAETKSNGRAKKKS